MFRLVALCLTAVALSPADAQSCGSCKTCMWRGSCKSGGGISQQVCSSHGGKWCASAGGGGGGDSFATVTVHIINAKNQCGESTFPTAWQASALKWVKQQGLTAQVGPCSAAGYTQHTGQKQRLSNTGAPGVVVVDLYTKAEMSMTVRIINSKNQCGESTFPTAWKASALKWVKQQGLTAQVGLCSEAGYTEYSGTKQRLSTTGAPSPVDVEIYTKPTHPVAGLHFEAYHYPEGTSQTLKDWGSPLYSVWNGMRPFMVHGEHQKDVWYSNDKDFVREIPEFSKTDYFIMRWSGWLNSKTTGLWQFRTNSDDGSRLYIDNKLVVENDGLHGMTAKQGNVNLNQGWHKLVITFFEKNGGAALQVSVAPPQGSNGGSRHWQKLTAEMTKPGKDALMPGNSPGSHSHSGSSHAGPAPAGTGAAAGHHLYFYTINKKEHRCGQVDAATRMPASFFEKGSQSSRYMRSYISATRRAYRVPNCRSCRLYEGTCAQHGYKETDQNNPGMKAKWPLNSRYQKYYCGSRYKRSRDKHGTSGLCTPANNAPVFVDFFFKRGEH